jgi:hypothetical protein
VVSTRNLLKFVDKNRSPHAISELERSRAELINAFKRMKDKFLEAIEAGTDNEVELVSSHDEHQETFNTLSVDLLALIMDCE